MEGLTRVQANQIAEEKLKEILEADYENYEQYLEVDKLDNLDVAKSIIRRLLDRLQ